MIRSMRRIVATRRPKNVGPGAHRVRKGAITAGVVALLMAACLGAVPSEAAIPKGLMLLNDNGGWCWFQDERAIIHDGKLIVGSVAHRHGTDGRDRHGNIELTILDLGRRAVDGIVVLHPHLEADDHDAPALLVLPDGRLLAVYARHGTDKWIRYRITDKPDDPLAWGPEQHIERPAGVTYSNVFRLSAQGRQGRIYDFYRGENWNPNFVVSDDDGQTWQYGGHLVVFKGRPYVKYASDGVDTIHFVTTEHHPRNYDNSIYHAYLRDGVIYATDGRRIQPVIAGPIRPEQATRVFPGDADNVAWPIDLHLDDRGQPWCVYSVQKNRSSQDLRYRYARWDGRQWNDHALAFAGSALYEREADYSGLAALDPRNPDVVYVSTNADPVLGTPLISAADGRRHYEIFKAVTDDGGAEWTFTPITKDSTVDNLRPIVPVGEPTVLLWLRGTYSTYTDYDLDVVALIDP